MKNFSVAVMIYQKKNNYVYCNRYCHQQSEPVIFDECHLFFRISLFQINLQLSQFFLSVGAGDFFR